MKKFLSLVLALVMTMSLVTISAGAKDFTDDDKITYEEAVNVISEIGVVDGYADGKFNPTNTLTRQAAAKIICNLILGPTTAAELHADTAPYKDVPATSEFAGYIAYCAKESIISGYADGTFKPGNTLTGYAFMKMLLGALGYDQEIEGYVGGNWSINVAKQAIAIGLNDSLEGEFNGIKAVTREEACLYAFNTLKSDLVEYDTTISTTINGQTVTIGNSQAKAMQWKNSATRKNNIKADNYIQFAEQYFTKLYLDETVDCFGRPARDWEFNGKDIGTYVNYDLLVKEYTTKVTGKDLYDLLGKTTIEDYDTVVYIDGVDDVKVNSNIFNATAMNKNNKAGVGATGDGVLTQVFVDSDSDSKDITIAIINTYLAIAASDYSEKKDEASFDIYAVAKKTVNGSTEFVKTLTTGTEDVVKGVKVSGEDFDVADVAEKDAYLVNVAEGEIKVLTKAEVVADTEITSFKIGSNVTAEGTKYGFADTAEYDYEVLDFYTGVSDDINLKDLTYNIYLDQYGYLIGIDLVETPKNYVFVTGVDTFSGNLNTKYADANVIFLDGTSDVVKVDLEESTDPNHVMTRSEKGRALVNTWFSYTVDKNNVYTLKVVADKIAGKDKVAQWQTKADQAEVKISKKNIDLEGAASGEYSSVYGNDASIYLTAKLKTITTADGTTTATIITGADNVTTGVKNANMTVWGETKVQAEKHADYVSYGAYTLYKDNGYIIASVVVCEDEAASKNLVYVHSDGVELESYDKAADEWTWTRKVIVDGVETEIKEVGSSLKNLDDMDRYNWYQVKYNADGEVVEVLDGNTDADFTNWTLGAHEYVNHIADVKAAVNDKDTVLYTEYFGAVNSKPVEAKVPQLKGSTLYVTTTNTTGFHVAEDVNIVLIQKNDNKQTTTYETGVENLEDVLADMNNGGTEAAPSYSYQISAILESGSATTVIVYDQVGTGNSGDKTPVVEADYEYTTLTPAVETDGTIKVTATSPIDSWQMSGTGKVVYTVSVNGGTERTFTQTVGTAGTDTALSAITYKVPGLTVKNGTDIEINVVLSFTGKDGKTYTVSGTGYII